MFAVLAQPDPVERARILHDTMDFSRFATLVSHKSYTIGNGLMHVTQAFNTGVIEVLHGVCEPGCKVETHTHKQMENILLYEGEVTVTVNGIAHHMTPGSTINIPANVPHATESAIGCKLLVARIPPTDWDSLHD